MIVQFCSRIIENSSSVNIHLQDEYRYNGLFEHSDQNLSYIHIRKILYLFW